jgi:hypothetical protein
VNRESPLASASVWLAAFEGLNSQATVSPAATMAACCEIPESATSVSRIARTSDPRVLAPAATNSPLPSASIPVRTVVLMRGSSGTVVQAVPSE